MNTFKPRFLAALVAILALSGLAQTAHAQTALTNYAENAVIDRMMRAQSTPAFATNWYVALFTSACSDSAAGTEVAGNNYGRALLAASLANWAGTQSAGSTVASSGTGGQTSNNSSITFATPSATWGTVTHWGLYDAVTAGNMWICAPLALSKTINNGDTVSFAAGALTVAVD